jgi:stage V sporulation protein AE
LKKGEGNMEYLWAFVIGGLWCAIGQLLIDYTKLTPARILTLFVMAGVTLGAIGVYEPLVNFAGAGATVPLTGFGYNLSNGVKEAVAEQGLLGAFTGGLTATAGGISAVMIFAIIAGVIFKSGDKQD